MTPDQFKQIQSDLRLTDAELGRALRLRPANAERTVRGFKGGGQEISGPVAQLMWLFNYWNYGDNAVIEAIFNILNEAKDRNRKESA